MPAGEFRHSLVEGNANAREGAIFLHKGALQEILETPRRFGPLVVERRPVLSVLMRALP